MLKRDLAFLLALIVILFGIYWKTFNYDLIWDDASLLKDNPLFVEDHPVSAAFKMGYFSDQMGVQGQDHYYRPLLVASFMVENRLWGIDPPMLRLTNLLIYFFGLAFLFLFLKRQKAYPYFPEIVTLLFALYPLNMDNIVWVVGRGDLLMLLWAGLCFLFLDLSLKRRRTLYLFLSSASFLLGMFSKETFVVLFPLLIVYEAARRKKIAPLYHLANLGSLGLFFFLKNFVLDLKGLKLMPLGGLGQSLGAAMGTLGYYFRTMIYPLRYDAFVPTRGVATGFYVTLGVIAVLLTLLFLLRSLKDKKYLLPSLLFAAFTGTHVLLIFTNAFPYQIYSRYMMVSGLALIWILALALRKVPEKPRFVVTFVLLVLFIPAIVLNSGAYKNSGLFWERATESLPRDAYVLSQAAKTAFEQKDYLTAELLLNRSLSTNMKPATAILVSSAYTDLEIARADYTSALRWLGSIEEFESLPSVTIAPFMRYQLNEKKAEIETSKGEIAPAEALLKDNLARYSSVRESYTRLYDLYIGREMWDKAGAVEKAMKAIYPVYFHRIDTAATRKTFEAMGSEARMGFYIKYRNFPAALALLKAQPNPDLDRRLFTARLCYYAGQPDEGEKIVAEISEAHPRDVAVLNKIGYLFLGNLLRVKPALAYFDRSLNIERAQPEIISLTARLKTGYIAKLKPVWQ